MSASVLPSPATPSKLAGPDAHPFADAAEEVRAWLVTARGGAPFLSAGDGRLLADWLESGVPVRDLLRAIDETSARRRARRLRQAFSLRTIEPALRRLQAGGSKHPRPAPADLGEPASPERPGAPAHGPMPWPDATALVVELRGTGDQDDEAFLHVSRRVREFFDAAWAELAPFHAVLIAAALDDLGDVADELDDHVRDALCEEYARERVRSHYPELRSGGLLG